MYFDQISFCVAPWFQIRNDQDRTYRPCCQLQPELSEFSGQKDFQWPEATPSQYINSEYAGYLRNNIRQGHRLAECNKCWRNEATGATSLRQTLNNTVTDGHGHELEKTWLASFFKTSANQTPDLIISYDIKISNLCNYACVMCHPEDSTQILTKWRRDRNLPIIRARIQDRPGILDRAIQMTNDHTKYDLLKHAIDLLPRHLKILGGEPLIDPKIFEILEKTDIEKKRKIKLLFVTNGSVDLSLAKERLKDWKDVLFVVSLEGVKQVQDYIRQGSNWNQIENSIKKYLRHPDHRLYLNFCVQSLTVGHLPDLLEFAQDLSMSVSITTVDDPDYLSLAAIPDALRLTLRGKLEESRTKFQLEHRQLIDAVLSLLSQESWNPTLTQKKSQYLDWYDPDQRWRSIFPEWVPYLR